MVVTPRLLTFRSASGWHWLPSSWLSPHIGEVRILGRRTLDPSREEGVPSPQIASARLRDVSASRAMAAFARSPRPAGTRVTTVAGMDGASRGGGGTGG